MDYFIWGGRSGGGSGVAKCGRGEVLLGMTCQIDHFSNFEKDISTCRSVDCCRNMTDTVFHNFLNL